MCDPSIGDYLLSAERGSYVMVSNHEYGDKQKLLLLLNDRLEYRISEILLLDPEVKDRLVAQARAMCRIIGGYDNIKEIEDWIRHALLRPGEDPDDRASEAVGTEEDLVSLLTQDEKTKYAIDRWPGLDLIRTRQDILSGFRTRNAGLSQNDPTRAKLFRKIYYTYKLWEALLGQVGYYNGSLELLAGLTDDFKYWMYLIQMKLRKPTRQFLYPAPKSMSAYRTEPATLLPWNNQFSFSIGFHEFGDGEIPRYAKGKIESRLVAALRDDARWTRLVRLVKWDIGDPNLGAERAAIRNRYPDAIPTYVDLKGEAANGTLKLGDQTFAEAAVAQVITVDACIVRLTDEVAKKAFFTLVLELPWSDEFLKLEFNAFYHLYAHGTPGDRIVARDALRSGWGPAIKDPRLQIDRGYHDPIFALSEAKQIFNCVGTKANVVVEPTTAMEAFKAKLGKLTLEELKDLYGNAVSLPEVREQAVRLIGRNAQVATQRWLENCLLFCKPIYTGPSGHALTYISLYTRAREALERSGGLVPQDAPTLEEARLVVIAGLIGRNQHHSYDEVMTGAEGVTLTLNGRKQRLVYGDIEGYKDLLKIDGDPDHVIAGKIRKAAFEVAAESIKRFNQEPQSNKRDTMIDIVRAWHRGATGIYFSIKQANGL